MRKSPKFSRGKSSNLSRYDGPRYGSSASHRDAEDPCLGGSYLDKFDGQTSAHDCSLIAFSIYELSSRNLKLASYH